MRLIIAFLAIAIPIAIGVVGVLLTMNPPEEAPPVVSGIYQLLSGRSQPFSCAVRIGGVPHSAGVS